MTASGVENVVMLALSAVVAIYLIVALVFPERF